MQEHKETVLFAPLALAVMSEDEGVFKGSKVLVTLRDRYSSTLFLERADGHSRKLVLDLAASVQRERKDLTESGNFSSFQYIYSRFGVTVNFEVIPYWWGEEETINDEDANEAINAFEFILSQFTYALFSAAKVGVDPEEDANKAIIEQEEHDAETNGLAYGLEVAGKGLRTGLRATGKGVGAAIRYVGSAYTQAAVKLGAGQDGPREVKDEDLAYGNQQRENCEVFHAGARSVTGTILAPVRYLGMQAGQHAPESDRTKTYESMEGAGGAEKTAAEEVLWGAGNGFVHLFKGVTEFVDEVGAAVGETALSHSKVVNGEEYAEKVTKLHVEGAGQVGLGLYKVGNVFSFGIVGIAADAVFEGSILLTALYEFLVGPVILHAWMDVSFPPSTALKRLYVVLRPFSISFYEESTQFAGRPYRVIPTSLLDTIPQLRRRTAKIASSHTSTGEMRNPLVDTSHASKALASGSVSSAEDLAQLEQQTADSQASYVERLTSIRSHVELCTVDCSSALLHPLVDCPSSAVESFVPSEAQGPEERDDEAEAARAEGRGEEALQEWFAELKAACLRVEEVAKKRSGASELAVTRRLGLLPKRKVFWFALKKLDVRREVASGKCAVSPSRSNSRATSTEVNESPLVGGAGSGSGSGSEADEAGASEGATDAGVGASSSGEQARQDGGGLAFFSDKLSAATMTAARVRVTPVVTDQSLNVISEETYSEMVPLRAAADGSVGDLECTFPEGTKLELGHAASLDTGSVVDGMTSFLLTVKVATMYGRDNAELGRAYMPVSLLQAGGAEVCVKLHKKGRRERVVGTLTLTGGFFDSQVEEETL